MKTINIQPGHIARHTPRNAGAQGREAAVVDVAQDLLLQRLHDDGDLDFVAIKGGTAIRKLYAGNEGRFSLDLDFSVSDFDLGRDEVAEAFASAVDRLSIGPFRYSVRERRGKWSVVFESGFVREPSLATKLDFSPAPWLEPVERTWVAMPIHKQYAAPLPAIKTVRLEENIAEKVARLNRTTTARDMYDLAWIMGKAPLARSLDLDLVRRLSVLKIWVDSNGLHSGSMSWPPCHEKSVFVVERWLRERSDGEFDLEDIGALAVPAPSPKELSESVRIGFSFLSNLTDEEEVLAKADNRDRSLAIRLLEGLPGGRFVGSGAY